MRLILLSLLIVTTFKIFPQGVLETIPDSLKENANEIVLYDNTVFEIKDIENTRQVQEYKAVIVNDKASDRNVIYLNYDEFTSITYAEVTISTLTGKVAEKYKLKDFEDYSNKDFSIAADNRVKYLKPVMKTPYIIEVNYEYTRKGSLFYPTWQPQSDENQSVISASLKINSNGIDFRFKSLGVSDPVKIDGSYEWKAQNLTAFNYNSYSPKFHFYAPVLYTAPNDFMMDGLKGNMNTWENLGAWQYELMKDQNTFTPEAIKEIKSIIPVNASTEEKIRLIYEYVQNSTRYVSIQLGIGGWKPFDTQFVHDKKYGDCKALSYYTKSLLDIFGIKSYYTLINAGSSKNEPFSDFPARAFNHVIVTVPMEKDTIWLECTSQTNPFGYLGTFTSDRNALMITEEGGKLIHTKTYTPEDNIQCTKTILNISNNGTASVKVSRSYSGLEIANNSFDAAILEPLEDQKKWFYDHHSWGSTKVEHLELINPSQNPVPTGKMEVDLTIEHFAANNSNRLFHNPFTFTNINWMDMKSKDRDVDLVIKYPYTQIDTTLVIVPAKYAPENLPKETSISNKYGSFSLKVNPSATGIELIRKFQIKQGSYAPSEYSDFRDFIKDVQKSDRQKIVMVDKT